MTIVLRVRYGQVSGDIRSFGTARRAQARACLSTGARVTVVLMTFRVLVQGGGGGKYGSCSAQDPQVTLAMLSQIGGGEGYKGESTKVKSPGGAGGGVILTFLLMMGGCVVLS